MKKILIVLMVAISLFAITGCNSDKSKPDKNAHPNVITGRIIEIKDSNTILIQITKERGGFKVDDKVLIKYRSFEIVKSDGQNIAGSPALNDEVSTHYWPEDLNKKDEYNYIEIDLVQKFE